jgi:hypothetical protein
MTIQEVTIQRVSFITESPFDTVLANLQAQMTYPDMAI